MYLLDTNIVSELRRPRPDAAVVAWVRSVPDADLHLSALSVGELQAGVENLRDRDAERAGEIESWVDHVAETYNILSMDVAAFRRWAKLMHRRPDNLVEDAMIAATALVHNLTVVTRNVRDFDALGVETLNPFDFAG
jgi:hypothetical protein